MFSCFLVSFNNSFIKTNQLHQNSTSKSENNLRLELLLGFIGLFVFLLLWPGIAVVHFTGFEAFTFPDYYTGWWLVISAVLSTFIGQVMWLYGTLYTSCLIGAMSLTLQIPFKLFFKVYLNTLELGDNDPYSKHFHSKNSPAPQNLLYQKVNQKIFNWSQTSFQQIIIGFLFIAISFGLLIYVSDPDLLLKSRLSKNRHSKNTKNKKKVPIKFRDLCLCLCHKPSRENLLDSLYDTCSNCLPIGNPRKNGLGQDENYKNGYFEKSNSKSNFFSGILKRRSHKDTLGKKDENHEMANLLNPSDSD